MATKEGVLRQSYANFDYSGDLFVFENDDDCDIGLFELMEEYILGKHTDRARVKIEAVDGQIIITRLALWDFDEKKQELAWIEDK